MAEASIAERSLYAFVESIERLAPQLQPECLSPAIFELLLTRQKSRLPEPTHVVWLDCIDSDFFDALPWKSIKVNNTASIESELRRAELQSIPADQLRAVLLLLECHDQEGILGHFRTSAWHRIVVGTSSGSPSAIGMDFEGAIEGPFQIELMRHEESYHGDALQPFITAFNLDFIKDMELREDSSGGTRSAGPSDKPLAPSGTWKPLEEGLDLLQEEERKRSEGGVGFLMSGG